MLRRGGRLLVVSLALVAGCGLQARESTTTAVDAQQTAETDATDLGTTDQPTTTLPEPTTTTAAPSTTAAPPTTPAPTTPPTTTPPTLPPTVPATAAPTMPPPPPPPQPFVGAPAGCDPNYTPCVPIDSDVDCAGGKGNGPSYVRGPVTVIGDDIYGLDRDGDGIGCE